ALSTTIDVTTGAPAPPPPPSDIQSISSTTSSVEIGWTNPGGYVIANDTVWWGLAEDNLDHNDYAGASTSYTISGLPANEILYVAVQDWVQGSLGNTYPSNLSSPFEVATLNYPPPAPTNLSATPASTSVSLTWANPLENPPGGISNDTLYQGPTCGAWNLTTSTLGPKQAWTVNDLAPTSSYCFAVSAWTNGGQGSLSTPVTVSTEASKPGRPYSLHGAATYSTTVSLTWYNPGGVPIVNDTIWYSSSCTGSSPASVSTDGETEHFVLSGLAPATNYCFMVQAYSSGGGSPLSKSDNVTTPNGPPPPPTDLVAIALSGSEVQLTWQPPPGSLIKETIYQASPACGSWTDVYTPASVVSEYDVGNLDNGTTYCFAISAWTSGAQSNLSNTVQVTTPLITGIPTDVVATNVTNSSVTLAWTNPSVPVTNVTIQVGVPLPTGLTCHVETNISANGEVDGFTQSGLIADTPYCFVIVAWENAALVGGSQPLTVTTLSNPPPAPYNIGVAAETQTSVTLNWNNPNASIVNNTVLYGLCGSLTSSSSVGASFPVKVGPTTYAVQGLAPGTTYCFAVQAWTNGGHSPLSPEVVATTSGQSTALKTNSTDLIIEVAAGFIILVVAAVAVISLAGRRRTRRRRSRPPAGAEGVTPTALTPPTGAPSETKGSDPSGTWGRS
ncbi:MAG: fibronectin type III domain-containing protein, partial [Thermoplasmata archaeon]